jgi:hypothetical protein
VSGALTPVARDLSPEEQQARAEHAHELDQKIKAGLRAGREALWEVAVSLHEFDEENGWSALGYEKLGDWLADPEVQMQRTTFYRLTGAYRELVVIRKVDFEEVKQLEVSKVDIVLPAVRQGRVALDEALEDTKSMGARDLRDAYLSRPAPQVNPNVGTQVDPDGDVIQDAPDTVNDGSDTPTWAATGKALQDNGSGTDDGPVLLVSDETHGYVDAPGEGTVVYDKVEDVIDGTATEVEPRAVETERVREKHMAATLTLATDLAAVMWRVCEEVAPPEKKRMAGDLRGEVQRVTVVAVKAGLLDGVPVWMAPEDES